MDLMTVYTTHWEGRSEKKKEGGRGQKTAGERETRKGRVRKRRGMLNKKLWCSEKWREESDPKNEGVKNRARGTRTKEKGRGWGLHFVKILAVNFALD